MAINFELCFCMQLFSGGWGLASQSIPWKEVEVQMYALSMVSASYLLVYLLIIKIIQ